MFHLQKSKETPADSSLPERFRVSGRTLFLDRFMTLTIVGGGLLVIASVLGIFLFIFAETLPLFSGADVTKNTQEVPEEPIVLDALPDLSKDWSLLKTDRSYLYLFNQKTRRIATLAPRLPEGEYLTAASACLYDSRLVIGTSNGRIALIDRGAPVSDGVTCIPVSDGHPFPVTGISFAAGDDATTVAAVLDEGRQIRIVTLDDEGETASRYDPGPLVPSAARSASVNPEGESLIVQTAHDILYFRYDDEEEEWSLAQTVAAPLGDEGISVAGWIFGGNSVLVGGERGTLKLLGIYPQKNSLGRNDHLFGCTKTFEPMDGRVNLFVPSPVNRSFWVASDHELMLCQSTTGDTRWSQNDLGYTPASLSTDEPFRHLAVVGRDGEIHQYAVDDRHPEAGAGAFFSKIRYEGYATPEWQWQSVGGADSYEAKLSLVPLVFGTLKGTAYALMFAVPIAVLAAIYTARFMSADVKKIVKPTMEIMASLPSVVLGFFGALYIAPLMEHNIPALACIAVLVPAAALGLGAWWARRPVATRNTYKKGLEYLVLIPVTLAIAWFCWNHLGRWIEPTLVRAASLALGLGTEGHAISTFPDLWRNGFGLAYEQRNSLVVGFIMGFAVIPVIFTIAEDALSNVPPSLVNASEALGASRWQVVRTIVLPIAAAGIFSALMIGFGRAIGETMIVLMATGNTPVMDWNIFNGMRTLSANIATELPEAAEHSTHYRVLFLCAFILFVMTFALNTVAEVLRHRLRERYKIV